MAAYAAWVGLRREVQEPVIIVECSHLLDHTVLIEGLGDYYILEWAVVCPKSFGWPIARKRFWGILFHRVLVINIWGTLDNVLRIFSRTRTDTLTWHSFLIADDELTDEMRMEYQTLMARSKTLSARCKSTYADVRQAMHLAFTPSELKYYQEYHVDTSVHSQIWDLSQSHSNQRGRWSKNGEMYTIIKNPGIHFVDLHRDDYHPKRILTVEELFLFQGFPVVRRLSNPFGETRARCCSMESVMYEERTPLGLPITRTN
eukprot:10949126-Karenia_brevis.AAC.1